MPSKRGRSSASEEAARMRQEFLSSFGYSGLDIRLPALQRYVSEVSGATELTGVTEHLRATLHKEKAPSRVRARPCTMLQQLHNRCAQQHTRGLQVHSVTSSHSISAFSAPKHLKLQHPNT